jgi:tyrosyl-tRNA synthetase
MVHGEEEAQKAQEAARSAFGGDAASANIPTVEMPAADFEGEGKGLVNLVRELGLVPSNGEARRAIEQGGVMIDGEKITDTRASVTADMFKNGEMVVRRGKKKVVKLVLK